MYDGGDEEMTGEERGKEEDEEADDRRVGDKNKNPTRRCGEQDCKTHETQKNKKNYTGKRPQTVCRRTATEDPLRQPTSASQYEAPRQIAGILFTRHMFVSSVHFVSQDPLQESCLRFMS